MLASLLLTPPSSSSPPTPSYFPLLQSHTPSLHSSPPQTRTTTLHSTRNNCFCLEGVRGGGKGGAHGSLCGEKGVCEGQPVTSSFSPSFSSLVILFPFPPFTSFSPLICFTIFFQFTLTSLFLDVPSLFLVFFSSLSSSSVPSYPPLDLQMSSVIHGAREKDNKTWLSTTERDTFFIIKSMPVLYAATVRLSADDPDGYDSRNHFEPLKHPKLAAALNEQV